MYIYIYAHEYTCVYIHTERVVDKKHMYTYVCCIHICIYIYIYICVYNIRQMNEYSYIYIYIHEISKSRAQPRDHETHMRSKASVVTSTQRARPPLPILLRRGRLQCLHPTCQMEREYIFASEFLAKQKVGQNPYRLYIYAMALKINRID